MSNSLLFEQGVFLRVVVYLGISHLKVNVSNIYSTVTQSVIVDKRVISSCVVMAIHVVSNIGSVGVTVRQ